jgi:hypothetical protein
MEQVCSGEGDVTKEQVNQTVQHLCRELHAAVRSKGTGAPPFNIENLGFDAGSVETVLLSGLRRAGVKIIEEPLQPTGDLEPPWS